MKNVNLLRSFKYALRGILYCIKNERNMRIHTVATISVLAFSLFFNLSTIEYALLFITFALVISAEMFNTSAEELTDMASGSYQPMARIAKDVSAGAVMISSIFAVAVGIAVFWKPYGFISLYDFFHQNHAMIIILIIIIIIAIIFIILGPIGIKGIFYKNKNNIDK